MTQSRTADILEALLFSTDRPLSAARLASVLPVSGQDVEQLVQELNAVYASTGRAFRVRCVAGGYRLFTEPEFESYVEALAVISREARLSQAALETLAVVAYKQPVSKNDIEFVRGCDCDGVLRTLLSRRLLAIQGRSDGPGRPLLYATTDRFLEYFGLASLSDLPDWSEIAALVGDPSAPTRLTLVRSPEQAQEPASPEEAETSLPAESPLVDAAGPGDEGGEAFADDPAAAEELMVVWPREDAP